jgi:hypothetical protein
MTQLIALIWLKWRLFRNAMRSGKAVWGRAASVLVMLAALALSLMFALIAGAVGWALASADTLSTPDKLFNAFLVLTFIYLMWVVVPLSMGSGREFDPERLLLYPVSLPKLFAFDYVSDLTSLVSIFCLPAIVFYSIGAGLGSGNVLQSIPVALLAMAFGLALSKFVSTSFSSLFKRKRTRGETLIALVGVVVGLGGAFLGQIIPHLMRSSRPDFPGLRWTPMGAAAIALMQDSSDGFAGEYLLALSTLAGFTYLLVFFTYKIARRAALGMGGAKRVASKAKESLSGAQHAGWHLPFVSIELSAVIEKELRYAMRNAQLRVLGVMPLVLIAVRLMPSGWHGRGRDMPPGLEPSIDSFSFYSEGLMATFGVLYVFLLLSSLACNSFAFEGSGMRALILAPVERRTILIGKNIVIALIAIAFALLLLLVNQLVFSDLTIRAVVFVLLCLPVFAVLMTLAGNWLSMRFPKRLKFGKRLNMTGMTGLLLLPLIALMALLPVAAAAAGYLAQSLVVKYATLALFAGAAVALYRPVVASQGHELALREQEILEAVSGQMED